MIRVTRLDGTSLVVNVDLVQWVEETPDTVLSLASGEKLIVRETPEQIVERALEFRRALQRGPAPSPAALAGVPAEETR
jgi:flagellar protein FlbD